MLQTANEFSGIVTMMRELTQNFECILAVSRSGTIEWHWLTKFVQWTVGTETFKGEMLLI